MATKSPSVIILKNLRDKFKGIPYKKYKRFFETSVTVSYTHLTLPTICSV